MPVPPRFLGFIASALLAIPHLAAAVALADDVNHPGSAAPALKPIQLRLKRFEIPFSVAAVGQRPTEVQLLVSRDAGRQWTTSASQNPTGKTFLFETHEDGEYWFATRTIDASGNSYPVGDIDPLLFVRVDTTDPQLDLRVELTADMSVDVDLRCVDPWPNPASVRLEQLTDVNNTWTEVAGMSQAIQSSGGDGFEGKIRFKPEGDWHQVSLRAIVKDQAGNQTIATHQLQRPRLASTPHQLASSPLPHTGADAANPKLATHVNPYAVAAMQVLNPPPTRMAAPLTSAAPAAANPVPIAGQFPLGAETPPALIGVATEQLLPATPSLMPAVDEPHQLLLAGPGQAVAAPGQAVALPNQTLNAAGQSAPADVQQPKRASTPAQAMRPLSAAEIAQQQQQQQQQQQTAARPSLGATDPLPAAIAPAALPPLDPSSTSALIRFSGSRKFSLDYEVESAGRAGVEEVELWGTVDRGLTWKRWGADPDRQSPFDIETNNDGVYGFSIVVVGGNGLATPRPLSQSTPDIFVAVDTLNPVVRITGATYGDGDQTGSLLIRYECHDENLSNRPITLAFSNSVAGPWTTIAAGLENRGGHVWPADPQLPRQIYLRIDATDSAGNNGFYVLDTPIDIQGLAPRARIRGFNPITATAPANGAAPQTAAAPSAKFK